MFISFSFFLFAFVSSYLFICSLLFLCFVLVIYTLQKAGQLLLTDRWSSLEPSLLISLLLSVWVLQGTIYNKASFIFFHTVLLPVCFQTQNKDGFNNWCSSSPVYSCFYTFRATVSFPYDPGELFYVADLLQNSPGARVALGGVCVVTLSQTPLPSLPSEQNGLPPPSLLPWESPTFWLAARATIWAQFAVLVKPLNELSVRPGKAGIGKCQLHHCPTVKLDSLCHTVHCPTFWSFAQHLVKAVIHMSWCFFFM